MRTDLNVMRELAKHRLLPVTHEQVRRKHHSSSKCVCFLFHVSESINSIKAWNWLLFLLPQPNNATVISHVWRTEMYLFYLLNTNIFGTCMTHRLKCTVLCNFPLQWFSFAYSNTDLRTTSVVPSETNDTHYFVPLCTQTKLLVINSEGDSCFSS